MGRLIAIAVAVFSIYIANKVYPPYAANASIVEAIDIIASDKGYMAGSIRDIRESVNRRLAEDGIKLTRDQLAINYHKGKVVMALDYEVIVPVIWNIDAATKFARTWEVERETAY